jgi:hypothetical protein
VDTQPTISNDLDAILERNATALARIGELPPSDAALAADASLRDVADLVAEVRAAREVVEASRVVADAARSGGSWLTELAKLIVVLDAYDQAVAR